LPWRDDKLGEWLAPERSGEAPYWHLRLREQANKRSDGLDSLATLVEAAHADALNWLQGIGAEAFDPLRQPDAGENTLPPLASNYPHGLHTVTLQGYLGEILAGLIAENYRPFDLDWEVPVFLFRNHDAAIHQLERQRLLGTAAVPVPGRFGNDCLAFTRADGQVSAFLTCEAKCTQTHRSSMIAEGHEQLSSNNAHIPVDLSQLLGILRSREDADAEAWVAELSPLLTLPERAAPEHYDLFVYVCGKERQDGRPWMSTSSAHDRYTSDRELEAAEVRFDEIDEVILTAYPGHTISREDG
jgi:hypothetical protein